MSQERRQFPRLKLPEDTLAVDESLRQLGKVEEAGGGGLTIRAASEEQVAGLEPGHKLKLSIVEPAGHVLHTGRGGALPQRHDRGSGVCEQ